MHAGIIIRIYRHPRIIFDSVALQIHYRILLADCYYRSIVMQRSFEYSKVFLNLRIFVIFFTDASPIYGVYLCTRCIWLRQSEMTAAISLKWSFCRRPRHIVSLCVSNQCPQRSSNDDVQLTWRHEVSAKVLSVSFLMKMQRLESSFFSFFA